MKETLFSAIGEVDEALLLQSEGRPRKKIWKTIAASAACLALVTSVAIPLCQMQNGDQAPKQAKVVAYPADFGISEEAKPNTDKFISQSDSLSCYYSPEELVAQSEIIFRGKILRLENLVIDYDGTREHRARIVVRADSVIQGSISAGEEITILMPFGFHFEKGVTTSVTGTVEQMQEGMEGIFLMTPYSPSSYSEYNGARLNLLEVADGTLPDGERYCMLAGENGIILHDVWRPATTSTFTLTDMEQQLRELAE